MGLLDFGSTPEEGVKGPYTDYDAALTALRADASASDGDAYQLDSGQLFAAYVSEGPGILIPSDLYPRVTGYVDNASGDSYLTTADTKADLTGRGWTITESNEGTVTGGDGSAFRLDAGTNVGGSDDAAALEFIPSSSQSSAICLVKMQPISGGLTGQSIASAIYTGARRLRVSCSDGSNGAFNVVDSGGGNTNLAAAIGAITETSATWFLTYVDATATGNVTYFRRLESAPEESLSVEVADLPTTGSNRVPWLRCFQGSTGSQTVIDVYESHALVTT